MVLSELRDDVFDSDIELLLLVEEVLVEVLLHLLLLLTEILLPELHLHLMLFEGGQVLGGGRRVVVDDHSVDVVLKNYPRCLSHAGQAVPSIESLELGVFYQQGLSVVGLILLPLQRVLAFDCAPVDAESDQFCGFFVLHDVVDGVESVEDHFGPAF